MSKKLNSSIFKNDLFNYKKIKIKNKQKHVIILQLLFVCQEL